ncbi:hypothetical protein A3E89_01790 [Candidatus Campbellbacteria bacterium RIFCSPHIGHO2_12_FULL_35_10]|uniref:Uncharacterized protein n=1 Tax=Candidatus Campbellbacteria bacterium RIFCSPHIGHO2_12_FULL_35_10 TaxID=1797578 RepID=A0A1F5EMR9_9BACT|nr:MAG: hypothetical protein A3E89_01790 [Candidatus Campbellbacteria bacterium RIFCSPHIGHO2_12_FULL_35_10]
MVTVKTDLGDSFKRLSKKLGVFQQGDLAELKCPGKKPGIILIVGTGYNYLTDEPTIVGYLEMHPRLVECDQNDDLKKINE